MWRIKRSLQNMSLLEKDYAPRWTQSLLFQGLPWILTLVFMATSFAQYELREKSSQSEEYSLLRPTDFKSASSEIELEIVTFTGAPVFMENGTFHVPNPGKTRYTGPPSPEIDNAWEEITAGRYFRITAEEAIEAFGSASDVYWNDKVGGYMAGIDMFHALHCLNRLRQSFWPDYYPPSTHPNTVIHQDAKMCSGDMTLIPTEWTDYLGRNYVNSDVPHRSTMIPESSVKHHEKGQDQ
ncbi:hypothetical protein GGI42DRAFT_346536 [Trichoderma sp. SZMC 28013]